MCIRDRGFTLPLALKNCFQHGDTKLVLSVPSENGDNRGLLLTDTQNWEYIEDGRSFFKVKVFPKPEDGVRALHALSLIHISPANAGQVAPQLGILFPYA